MDGRLIDNRKKRKRNWQDSGNKTNKANNKLLKNTRDNRYYEKHSKR